MSRTYQLPDEAVAERQRAEYIQTRRSVPGVTGQRSGVRNGSEESQGSGDSDGSAWGSGFQPRERVETVRNCAALPRDFVEGVVLRVAGALLGMTEDAAGAWNTGGKHQSNANDLESQELQIYLHKCSPALSECLLDFTWILKILTLTSVSRSKVSALTN